MKTKITRKHLPSAIIVLLSVTSLALLAGYTYQFTETKEVQNELGTSKEEISDLKADQEWKNFQHQEYVNELLYGDEKSDEGENFGCYYGIRMCETEDCSDLPAPDTWFESEFRLDESYGGQIAYGVYDKMGKDILGADAPLYKWEVRSPKVDCSSGIVVSGRSADNWGGKEPGPTVSIAVKWISAVDLLVTSGDYSSDSEIYYMIYHTAESAENPDTLEIISTSRAMELIRE